MKPVPPLILAAALALVPLSHGQPAIKELATRFFSQPEVLDARITPGNRGLSYLSNDRGDDVLKLLDFASRSAHRGQPIDRSNAYDYYWIDRDTAVVFTQVLGSPVAAYATNYNLGAYQDSPFTLVYDTLPDRKNVYLAKQGRVTDKFPDLYQVNAYTHSKIRVEENPGNVIAWYTDKDGFARIRYTIDESETDRFDYRSKADEPWRPLEIDGHPLGVLFLDESDVFALFIRRNGFDKFAAYRFDAKRNEYLDTIVEDPVHDILYTDVIVDPETEETFGFRYPLEKPQTFWFDDRFAAAQQEIDALHPDTTNDILGFANTDTQFVYHRFSDRHPGEWRIFHIDSRIDELLLTASPQIDPAQNVPIEPVTFAARDGHTVHGYLTQPKNWDGSPSKTLIMLHGGPRTRDVWGWDHESQFFSVLGYAVLKINYRGSEGYGVAYSRYSHYSSMRSSVMDTVDAARWLVSQDIADSERIAVYGSSFGGHVALSSAAEAPGLFASAIGYAGVYDWLEKIDADFKDEPIYATLKKKTYYGDYDNERDKWLQASALSKVDRIDCPVFLIHGRSDTTVSSTQSRRMHKALKKAGKDSHLKLLSFNRHGLAQEKHRIDFYTQLATFLEATLAK